VREATKELLAIEVPAELPPADAWIERALRDRQDVAAARFAAEAATQAVDVATGQWWPSLRIDLERDAFASLDDIRNVPIAAGGRLLKLGDFTKITRGYEDPPMYTVRHNGQQVLMLGITMTNDGNIVELGKAIDEAVGHVQAELPHGVELERVADQPTVVSESIWEFERSLMEALAIVLAVCLISLGWRTGIVVGLSVPIVLGGIEASLRRWRRYSIRYSKERNWVERWLHMIDRALTRQPAAAPAVIDTASMVQGYGDAYRYGLADWHAIIDLLAKPTFDGMLRLPNLPHASVAIGKTAEDNVAEYRRRSPAWNAEKLQTPLLIHTTTNDEDVNVLEVEHLVQALKAAGKNFDYKVYTNAPGGHAFNRIDTRLAKESRAEIYRFLAKYLNPPNPVK
jgi:hypothetical protein